ncbi:response regulator transcription factor [Paragemmobacter aquarius]|nr:response regulator transcription factor [Gemmobacter aquarius]
MTAVPLRIAIVEDNTDLNGLLVNALRSAGFDATGYASVEDFERSDDRPHIFLLDLNLPGEDGLSFARRLRGSAGDAGIVMLTARNDMDQRRSGYDSGADIYLTKPSSVDEILGALNALGRRLQAQRLTEGDGLTEGNATAPPVLTLSPRKLEVTGPAGSVSITAAEAAVLAYCASDPNGRISLAAFDEILPEGAGLSKVAIELKVVRLRKKLAAAGFDGRSIGSVRNYGYQLLLPVKVVQA